MNKRVFGRKLSRSRPAREALFASLSRAMILSGKIKTTHAKAKAIQGDLERFISLAKKGDLRSRRTILANLDNAKDAVGVLFKKVVPAFSSKNSGFTRLISLPTRKGDNAKMVRIEWTEKVDLSEPKKVEKAASAKATASQGKKVEKKEEKPVKKSK